MFNRSLFSSMRGDWKTPKELLIKLQEEFGELFDVSDRHDNTFDALTMEWPQPWYCNPPYGREISNWIELMQGNGVALLPARTDTKWFHDLILPKAHEIRFIKGRLKFDDCKNSAPFPSMIVIFRVGEMVRK